MEPTETVIQKDVSFRKQESPPVSKSASKNPAFLFPIQYRPLLVRVAIGGKKGYPHRHENLLRITSLPCFVK